MASSNLPECLVFRAVTLNKCFALLVLVVVSLTAVYRFSSLSKDTGKHVTADTETLDPEELYTRYVEAMNFALSDYVEKLSLTSDDVKNLDFASHDTVQKLNLTSNDDVKNLNLALLDTVQKLNLTAQDNARKKDLTSRTDLKNNNLTSHHNWIVLDVTDGKCERNLQAPPGWKILVTGKATPPVQCGPPTCLTLTLDPDFTRGRKEGQKRMLGQNLAYLTAIAGGALRILDATCSVSLTEAVQTLQLLPVVDHGIMYNETLLFNPYAHFGAWAAVPRSLGDQYRAENSRLYYIRDFKDVLVKHGLSDASRDVLVRGPGRGLGARFDPFSPPVFVGQSFSPTLPAVSMFHEKAFWGLVMPCLSPSPRCLILRQLLVQRLFRELDAFSGFYQIRTSSDVTGQSQGPGSVDAGEIVRVLDAWNCEMSSKFFGCIRDLADHLLRENYLNRQEHSLIKAWLAALRSVGAVEPVRVSSPWRGVRKSGEIRATLGSMQSRLESGGSEEQQHVKEQFVQTVENLCNRTDRGRDWFPEAQWRRPLIPDVVMLVFFNSNSFFWHNLPVLETMHRPFFKHIVYCVPNLDELLNERREELKYVSVVEGMSDGWFLLHECLTTVIRINYQGVRGYLHIGDDTLLNTWNMLNASRDSLLMPPQGSIFRADDVQYPRWAWWKLRNGRYVFLRAMAGLERISGLSALQLLPPVGGLDQLSMMSQQQLSLLDPQVKKTWFSRPNVTTFSELYSRYKVAAASLVQQSLAGSEVSIITGVLSDYRSEPVWPSGKALGW